jgi:cyclophilin family peptidyl-prolyl cis-trans isomerase
LPPTKRRAARVITGLRARSLIGIAILPLSVAIAGIIWGVTRPPPPPCIQVSRDTRGHEFEAPPCPFIDRTHRYIARLETTLGEITITLLPEIAPVTVNNFVFLARSGFYDGTTFHRIEDEPDHAFVQTGDRTGTGKGGPGYTYQGETPSPITVYVRGTVAMAHTGDPSSNASQFFIIARDWDALGPPDTTPSYTFFGFTDEPGIAVVDQMLEVPREGTRPTAPIVLERVTIEELDGEGNPLTPSPSPGG